MGAAFRAGDDLADSNTLPKADVRMNSVFLELWRVALVGQVLTSAHNLATVEWKRRQPKRGVHRFVAG